MTAPQTKIAQLRAMAAAGDWPAALRLAAKFPRLGEHGPAIKRAHEAIAHPAFWRHIGKDPEALVLAGIEALRERYGLGA